MRPSPPPGRRSGAVPAPDPLGGAPRRRRVARGTRDLRTDGLHGCHPDGSGRDPGRGPPRPGRGGDPGRSVRAARRRAPPVPAAGLQPDRDGAPHQSRSRPAAPLGRGGGGRRDGAGEQPRIRSGDRRPRRARRPCRGADLPPDRRRGRGGRQQQRGGGPAGAERARHAQGGGGLPRRARGDRRLVPGAGRDGAGRLPPARGRHHQPHPPARLCGGPRAPHRLGDEGASEQLRHRGLHRGGGSRRPPRPLPGAGRAAGGRPRQRQPRRPRGLRPAPSPRSGSPWSGRMS